MVLSSLHILVFGQGRVRRHSLMVEGCLDLGGFALQGGGGTVGLNRCTVPGTHRVY